jgi:hypothetical protein
MNIKTAELREKDVVELPADSCVVLAIREGDKSLSKKKTINISVRLLSGPFKGTEGTFVMVSDDDDKDDKDDQDDDDSNSPPKGKAKGSAPATSAPSKAHFSSAA